MSMIHSLISHRVFVPAEGYPGNCLYVPSLGALEIDAWGDDVRLRQALHVSGAIHIKRMAEAKTHRACGFDQLLRFHLGLLHFQFRISGMSWPCSSMYCLCSISLSLSCCLRY